ncbi:HD family phosphohydrolase [Longirhabdus pacifica]|uniref:HD family phosphohydrolase n=1 Tax=Longirhabdus pacifica TaxID=2305227 RepID=UPI0010092121|nr:HD family phosphohydrolase [Longirhabdus pacifica]
MEFEFSLLWLMINISIIIIICIIGYAVYDKRYKAEEKNTNEYNENLVKTKEIFIDPKDGKKYRVYFNPDNGKRSYIQED